MEELRFQVVVDRNLDRKVQGVIAFGDFEGVVDSFTAIYGSQGVEPFYRDLILGRPFPFTLVTRELDNLGILVSIALFLHRDLAIHPALPGLVSSVTLVDAYGVPGLAHVDRDMARFFRFLMYYMALPRGKKEQQEALLMMVGWVRAYVVEGSLPAVAPEKEPPRVIDQGTDGFVVATSTHPDLQLGWEELYRMGFLRGVLMHQSGEDRWKVLAARKSAFLALDLPMAAGILNEAEAAMGEPEGWVSNGAWLSGPEQGTLLTPSALIQVFLRV